MKRSEASASFVKLAWMSKEQRQSSKLLEPRSFDVYKNTTAPIIVILGYSKLNMEVSDIGLKTVESDNYKEMLRNNKDVNSMLATTWEEARFSHKDRWKFINPFT